MQLPFTGRAEQLAQIKNLMAAKEGAFFVVTGHAGIGKSTLLRHIAELYPQQGQVFVDISDIPPLQTAVEFLQHFAKCAKGLKHTEAALAKIKGAYKTAEDLIAPYKTLLGETAKLGYENYNSELSKDEQGKFTKIVSST
ncbi:MAG: AAA family ATPase [Thiotrichaceae bacterium]|nr:AAA family ATPase [Thiotrichaceae bacterium]